MLDQKEEEYIEDRANASKGMLFSRVALTDLSNLYSMFNGLEANYTQYKLTHIGLVVFNTGVAPLFSKGLYVWISDKWVL